MSYQSCVVEKYFGQLENNSDYKTLVSNLDDYEMFEYKKQEYKGLYQKLQFFENVLYYRSCFNRDTIQVEMLMEQIKKDLLIVQKGLMELSYQIQVMSYWEPEFKEENEMQPIIQEPFECNPNVFENVYEFKSDLKPEISQISIVDTESMATTVVENSDVASVVSTVHQIQKREAETAMTPRKKVKKVVESSDDSEASSDDSEE